MSKAQFMSENLRDGEIYAGLLLGKNGEPDQHIFLLPGKTEKVDWDAAKKWASKRVGGADPPHRLLRNGQGHHD